jgi:hypothetical protein
LLYCGTCNLRRYFEDGKCEMCAHAHVAYPSSHIKQNKFEGDLLEYGAIAALFEDITASEVGVTSGAQSAFDAARIFIKEMVQNQCELAGCALQGQPYGIGDVHAEKCWFAKRIQFYSERAKAGRAAAYEEHYGQGD